MGPTHLNSAGYAYKPQTIHIYPALKPYDGLIFIHDYVGSIGTSSLGLSRQITHEVGHWFGLDHTWGESEIPNIACGDDGINDTPITKGHLSCINLWDTTCVSGVVENVQNFMEFSFCTKMFTQGQVDRMTTISFVDNYASRLDITLPTAHHQAGIDTTWDCPPNADFTINRTFACLGQDVIFKDRTSDTTGITPLSYKYILPHSNTGNGSTTFNLQTSFTTKGWSPITYIASGATGADTAIKNNYLFIADPADKKQKNYYENFEIQSNRDLWPLYNTYNNYFKWGYSNGGYGFGKCLKMNTYDDRPAVERLYGNALGDVDEIVTSGFDLIDCINCNLSFWSSGATNTIDYPQVTDELRIFFSTNCGNTWVQLNNGSANAHVLSMANGNLFNKLQQLPNYVPSSNADWVARNIPLHPNAVSNNTYFKFVFKSSEYSNNLYLDDIGVGNYTTEVRDLIAKGGVFSVSPNPNNGEFVVSVANTQRANLLITDITGKLIASIDNNTIAASNGTVRVGEQLTSGIYMVTLTNNGVKVGTQRFVVN
jgi:hypothetical protein